MITLSLRILAILAHTRDGLENYILAERLGTSTASCTSRLNVLRKAGYVFQRERMWHITPEGIVFHNSHKVKGGF